MADKSDTLETQVSNAPTGEQLEKSATVDTVHNDQAVEVLYNYQGEQTWTPEEEKRLVRKIDLRLMCLLCVTFGLQYYDKAMLSQAAIFQLIPDLRLNVGIRYSMSAAIFYLGYIAGAYPNVLLAQRFPIDRFLFALVIVWGICLIATAGVSNWQGLYAQRFFLGLLESGVAPTFMMVVGQWYKKDEQGLRMGIWYSCAPWVSLFSPLVNYGIGHIDGALSPWRYMYLVAGSLTILWAFVILFCMDSDPIRARHLNEREKYIAVSRMRSNNAGVRNTHMKKDQVIELFLDVKFWLNVVVALCLYIANGPLSSFVPILINQMGFSGLHSLLLTMPLGAIVGSATLIVGYLAGRLNNMKLYLVAICTGVTLLSAALMWGLPTSNIGGRLFAVYILGIYNCGYSVLMTVQIANTSGYTKRSLSSAGIHVGYCLGNFIGPLVFLTREAPHYTTGFATVTATSALAIILALLYRYICIRENKARDDRGIAEGYDHAYEEMTDKKNPQFRYTY